MQRRRNPEVIAGRVNADGTIAAAVGDFTVNKSGTGVYNVTLPAGFRLQAVTATCHQGPYGAVTGSPAERTFLVSTFSSTAGTSADVAHSFIAVGVQA